MSKKLGNKSQILKVLIVSVHSSKNAGDFALLAQTIYFLRKALGNIEISVVANWPEEPEWARLDVEIIASPWWILRIWDKSIKPRFQVFSFMKSFFFLFLYKLKICWKFKKIVPKEWITLYEKISSSDLMVAVSGNQIFSSGKFGWPLPVVSLPIFLGKVFRKTIVVFPQSIGPLKTKFEKMLVRYLYSNLEKVYIRDTKSMELVKKLGLTGSKPSFMFDPAFTFPPISKTQAIKILTTLGFDTTRKNIGITVISNMPSYLADEVITLYYQSLAETITKLVEDNDAHIYMFSQVRGPTDDEDDRKGIARVLNLIPENCRTRGVTQIEDLLSPEELKACYGQMDLFIASRLHSGIFSMSMGVPTLFIGYLHKTLGMLISLGMEKYYLDINYLSTSSILNYFYDMWGNRSEIIKEIDMTMVMVVDTLNTFPYELTEVFLESKN